MSPQQKLAEDQLRQAKVMRAYREVFGIPPAPGQPDLRSESQITVWADLRVAGYFDRSVYVPDERTGALCPIRANIAEGRRSLFLYVKSNVDFAPQLVAQQPQ